MATAEGGQQGYYVVRGVGADAQLAAAEPAGRREQLLGLGLEGVEAARDLEETAAQAG